MRIILDRKNVSYILETDPLQLRVFEPGGNVYDTKDKFLINMVKRKGDNIWVQKKQRKKRIPIPTPIPM